jgi:hypothetical protein
MPKQCADVTTMLLKEPIETLEGITFVTER